MAIRRYLKKPSIPSLNGTPEAALPVLKPMKETLEIITGRKGSRLDQLAGALTISAIAERVNEIIRVLQDGADSQVLVGSDVSAPGAPAAPTVTTADLSAELLALLGVSETRHELILNGDFDLCQRYYTATTTSAGSGDVGAVYGPDGWTVATFDTGMPVSITWNDGTSGSPPDDADDGGPLRSFVRAQRVGGSVSNNQIRLTAFVEGYLYRPWRQSEITLTFQVRSSITGTYTVLAMIPKYDDAAAGYLCPLTYTINAADTWETKSLMIPVPPTIATINIVAENIQRGVGIRFNWIIRGGSGTAVSAGAWAGSAGLYNNSNTVTGQANGLQSTSDYFDLANVHTGGVRRSFGETVALARRYFQRSEVPSRAGETFRDYDASETAYRVGGNNSGAAGSTSATVQLSPSMRKTPSVITYAPAVSTATRVKRVSDGATITPTVTAGRNQFIVTASMAGFTDQRMDFCWAANAGFI